MGERMTHYRILTNGEAYRVQWRYWWWPFWINVQRYNVGGGASIYEWPTEQSAQDWIDDEIEEENRRKKEWRVVG